MLYKKDCGRLDAARKNDLERMNKEVVKKKSG